MRSRLTLLAILGLALAIGMAWGVSAWTPVDVAQDPLGRMPGTQRARGVAGGARPDHRAP